MYASQFILMKLNYKI